MISMTSIGSAGGIAKYLTETQAAIEYYADQVAPSSWGGKGAEVNNLSGAVSGKDLSAILNGTVQEVALDKDGAPAGSKETQLGRTRIDQETGKRSNEHRAGWDLTFSAPKSVSVESEVYGKQDVRQAHEKAVVVAMDYLEKHAAQTRVNGQTVQTGNLTFASFGHATSRAGDPQTHTHVIVANVTYHDGKAYSLSNENLMQQRTTADAVYKNELASELQKQGYKLDYDSRGNFEISGYSKENLDQFSKRSEQIDAALKERGSSKETASRASRQAATLDTRAEKGADHSESAKVHQERWQAEAAAAGITQAPTNELKATAAQLVAPSAKELVSSAAASLSEREQEFSKKDLVKEAMMQSSGRVSSVDLLSEIRQQEKNGDLVSRNPDKVGARYTTDAAIKGEQWADKQINDGRDGHTAVMTSKEFEKALSKFETEKGFELTGEQRSAAKNILTGSDQFSGIQGTAGTGKTTMLELVREAAESKGWKVEGMSTGAAQAAKLEADSGIKSTTTASFLAKAQAEERKAATAGDSKVKTKDVLGNRYLEIKGGLLSKDKLLVARDTVRNSVALGAVDKLRDMKPDGVLGKVALSLAKDTVKWEKANAGDHVLYHGSNVVSKVKDLVTETLKNEFGIGGQSKTLYINDEASMSGQKEFNGVIKASQNAGAKTVFVGDKAQHQGVAAGGAFERSQDKMQVSKLENIQRQTVRDKATGKARDTEAMGPVKSIIAGNHADAINQTARESSDVRQAVEKKWGQVEARQGGSLSRDQLQEKREDVKGARIADNQSAIRALAEDYSNLTPAQRDKTAVITATNADRRLINDVIRSELKSKGELGSGQQVETLRAKDMTAAQSVQASSYTAGDVLKRQERDGRVTHTTVSKIDTQANSVTVTNEKGASTTMSAKTAATWTAYTKQVKEFSPGDKVAFFENSKAAGVSNGNGGTVEKIDGHKMTVSVNGKSKEIDLKDYRQLDHGYVMTSHKSQGETVDRAMVHHNTEGGRHGQREAYVNLTRAKLQTMTYTQDKERAGHQASQEMNKTTATHKPRKTLGVPQAAPAAETTRTATALDSVDLSFKPASYADYKPATKQERQLDAGLKKDAIKVSEVKKDNAPGKTQTKSADRGFELGR